MLYGYIGCAVTLAAIFAIPTDLGEFAQYAWFFIAYTLLNAVFYTANNIAYSALTALITKNNKERVEMGSYRFIFAFSTSLLIQSVTLAFVDKLGGGADGWRAAAIIYAILGLIVNTISVLSVKELPEEELNDGMEKNDDEKYTLIDAAKLLFSNKYYVMICATYILQQIYVAMINMGLYYMMYILFNKELYPIFSWAINIPLIIALLITPSLVAKWKGMYKLNLTGYVVGTIGRALVVGCSIFRQCRVDACIYSRCCIWYRSMAGRHECCYCRMFGVYLSDKKEACRWNDVFVYIIGCKTWWWIRDGNFRMAFGIQWIQ